MKAKDRIPAVTAERADAHTCPVCLAPVVLKRGEIVTAHFAHKPGANCSISRGETAAHMEAKWAIHEGLRHRGLESEVEVFVRSLEGDRRADVLFTTPSGWKMAIEIQHTPISVKEASSRTASYVSEKMGVFWVPIVKGRALDLLKSVEGSAVREVFVEKYAPREYERWIHGFDGIPMWYWDAERRAFWNAKFTPHYLHQEERTWFESGGIENYIPGVTRESERWVDLSLTGPYGIDDLLLKVERSSYEWGYLAKERPFVTLLVSAKSSDT